MATHSHRQEMPDEARSDPALRDPAADRLQAQVTHPWAESFVDSADQFKAGPAHEDAMKKFSQYTCDGCRVPKQESNHWWLMRPASPAGALLLPWDEAEATLPGIMHLCGEGCVTRALTAWMGESRSIIELEKIVALKGEE